MMNSMILRVASNLLVPLSLLFSMFVYFKGHHSPGGGFVAGLVAAVALIVHRMSHGPHSMNRMLPFPERTFIGVGLFLALATGAAAVILKHPFFTSAHGPIMLPTTIGHLYVLELASVMVFDFGVFMVVLGVVVGMINTLSEELEICHLEEDVR